MKHCLVVTGLLLLTSCTSDHKPKPDLDDFQVKLTHPITITFLHEESGIIHFKSTEHVNDIISRKWRDGWVSGDLKREWDGNTLVIHSNISEYRVPYSSISYFSRRRPDVVTEYDEEENRHRIVNAKSTPAGDAPGAASEE